jgi:hypothetical protein
VVLGSFNKGNPVRISGSFAATSQLSIVVRPLLSPPCRESVAEDDVRVVAAKRLACHVLAGRALQRRLASAEQVVRDAGARRDIVPRDAVGRRQREIAVRHGTPLLQRYQYGASKFITMFCLRPMLLEMPNL